MDAVLFQRFAGLCVRAGIPEGEAEGMGAELERRYEGEGRHYHTLTHVGKMLGWLDRSGGGGPAMELAVWFHDAVYEPLGRANEAESAAFFERTMERFPGVDADLTGEVVRLILATDFRRPRTGRADESLLIDIDFSILGSDREEYDAYRRAVRREYAVVPEADFNAGRAAVLRHFLAGRIFATDFFAPMEAAARRNLEWELALLEEGGGG